jgi:hypothetical protein
VVHRDVKRALCSFWEDCEDGWMDQEQVGGTVWSSHMAKLMNRSRSRRISESSMGRALSGKRLGSGTSVWDISSTNQEGDMTGLGIAKHRSVTLKSRAATTGADSIADFYAANCTAYTPKFHRLIKHLRGCNRTSWIVKHCCIPGL